MSSVDACPRLSVPAVDDCDVGRRERDAVVIKDCALQSARDGVLDSRDRGILFKHYEAFSIDGARIAEGAPPPLSIQCLQGLSEHSVGWLAEIQTDVGF